jgi:predicted MPP superfamily phosphohydrolase
MSTRTLFILFFSLGVACVGFAQYYLFRKFHRLIRRSALNPWVQRGLLGVVCFVLTLMYLPYVFRLFYKWPEHEVSNLVLYGVLYPFSLWGLASVSTFAIVFVKDIGAAVLRLWKRLQPNPTSPPLPPQDALPATRREFLRWSFGAAAASPIGIFTYGAAVGKERYEIVERRVEIPRLSPTLQGLTIVQLTDIHVGNFMKQEKLERYVRVVNELKPDLVALTGDFIGSSPQFIPACAAALEKLEAREGVFACLGNHDYWVGSRSVTAALEAAGVEVLRNEGQRLLIRGAPLNIAGVDDPWRGRPDFDLALAAVDPNAPTIMLCHQPDLFPAIAQRPVDLTLSGHYHGGQIKFEFFGFAVSPAHLITAFVEGFYRRGQAQLYVSRGIGITGPPVRLNAPPEITVLRLTPSSTPG